MGRNNFAPPQKRRKVVPAVAPVEEISFDYDARQEYLTGFHKRKLERAKHGRELAEKKAREERVADRRRLREERKAQVEENVKLVNDLLKKARGLDSDNSDEDGSDSEGEEDGSDDEWNGIEAPPEVDHEAEYIDEDKYTTVTVETIDVSKEGLYKAEKPDGEQEEDQRKAEKAEQEAAKPGKRVWTKEKPSKPKPKKKKFRYETKTERKAQRTKLKAGKMKMKAKREG